MDQPGDLLKKILKEVQGNDLDLRNIPILKEKLFVNFLTSGKVKITLYVLFGYLILFPWMGLRLESNQVVFYYRA